MIESPPPDPWHFPRQPLDASVVDTLESGIVNAITLFAPRRMGKTQFVCTDLAPLARRQGWFVAYCNLWDDKANPAGAIVATLAAAAEPFRAHKTTGKVAVSANLGIVTADAEVSQEVPVQAAPSQLAGAFNDLAHAAAKHAKGKRLLLIIDEVQQLAAGKHEALAASLRTSLERHAGLVKTVFTGSSQHGLQRLFLDTRAPLFSPGGQMELPRLGADFVAFMVERANRTFRDKVTVADATRIFEASGHSPFFLRQAITVARLRELPIERALEVVIEETLNEEALARRWARLTAIERGVAMAVMEGKAPFANASLEELGQATGEDVKPHRVQNALLRLEREGLVERAMRGGYAIGDPMVRIWLERVRRRGTAPAGSALLGAA
jgi:hypothetical protein